MTVIVKKVMSKEEVLSVARRLVQEAVDVAAKAGIDPSSVLAPHCSETAVKGGKDGDDDSKALSWCDVPVGRDEVACYP
jgi:hypothetical protein